MRRLLFVFLLVMPSAALHAQDRNVWEWSDDERIAARTNAGAAKDRVTKYLESHAPQSNRAKVLSEHRMLVGVVDGSQTPELFLPTELFEMVVKLGVVSEENWRDVWEPGVKTAGLPPDFWKQLERATSAYAEDLRAAQRAGVHMRELPQDHGDATLQRDLATRLCRDRADALAASHALFGEALDVFMYQTIAPGHVLTVFDDPEEPARLRSMASGCR